MADASAIPGNLYGYSDQTTHGAQELQDWVRGVLSPTMREYEAGGGECFSIDGEVASAVSRAYYTDRDVRVVGQAFERAGSSAPGPLMPYFASNKKVDAEFTALEEAAAHKGELDAGAALAHRMTTHGDPANIRWITSQLAGHADDEFFAAGFFNALSANQIAELMGRGSNDHALASAYASGAVTSRTQANVVRALTWVQGSDNSPSHWHITAGTQIDVLQKLAGVPEAAVNFGRLLTPAQGRELFDSTPFQNGRGPHDYTTQATFLRLLTVAADRAESADEARELLEKMYPSFRGTPPPDELKAVLPALTAFLTAGGAHLMDSRPPALTGDPAKDDVALGQWAANSAANLGWLRPFVEWVEKGDEKADEAREKHAGGLAEFSIDVIVDSILEHVLPEGGDAVARGANLGIHGLFGTAAVQALEPRIAKMLSEGDNKAFDQALARQIARDVDETNPNDALNDAIWQRSRVMTTVLLFQHYHVYRHGKQVSLEDAFGTSDSRELPSAVLDRINKDDGEWAGNIEFRDRHGHVTNLSDVLSHMKDRAHGAPVFEEEKKE